MKNIPLKICGITNVKSVEVAHKNKIKSLGFASKNLNGPNTVSDKKIQSLIKECKNYKIERFYKTKDNFMFISFSQKRFIKNKKNI